MALSGLRTALAANSSYVRISSAASHPAAERTEELQIAATTGLRPAVVAEIAQNIRSHSSHGVVLAVTATDREADDLATSLECYAPEARVGHFPSWETLPHERLSPRSDTVGRRLGILRQLTHPEAVGRLDVVVAPIRAVIQPIVAGLGDLEPVTLRVGEFYDFDDAVARLSDAAYNRVDMVTRRGEFAVRGGILDVFPPNETHPVRVEFFGDEVEQLRHFSVADQLSIDTGDAPAALHAVPCRELLITDEVAASTTAQLIVEGANLPTTASARHVLHQRGVVVVPDFIANAGGIIAAAHSSDSRNSPFVVEPDGVFAMISQKLRTNATRVLGDSQTMKITSLEAAHQLAKSRVMAAMEARGLVLSHGPTEDTSIRRNQG